MANNKISVIIDVAVDQANRGLKSFRQSIQDADGAAGKFKAGASSALASVQANAGALAMAGGAALVAFGAKAVSAFQDTALAAGQMRDTLGVTAEEASRLIEVADDLGIGADSLEKSINIMNRTAANTPRHFEAIGAQLVKNADGTLNVNETFLSTIDALNKIPDASARAAAAQKVFGRGWTDMAELIGVGAEGVRKALASVEGGKIIDDKEVERAKKFRDRLDELRGVIEELQIELGGAIVDNLMDVAQAFDTIRDAVSSAGELLPDMPDWFGEIADKAEILINPVGELSEQINELEDATDGVTETTGTLGKSITGFTGVVEDSTDAVEDYRFSHERVGRAIDLTTQKIDALRNSLSERSGYLAAQEGLAALATQMKTTGSVTESQIIDMQNQLLDYADQLDDEASKERVTKIATELDQDSFWAAAIALERLAAVRTAQIQLAPILAAGAKDPKSRMPVGASGGIVNRPTVALIGEAGPEAVVPLNRTPGNGPLPAMGGGAVYNFTINDASDPDRVVNAIRQYVRRNGPVQGIT